MPHTLQTVSNTHWIVRLPTGTEAHVWFDGEKYDLLHEAQVWFDGKNYYLLSNPKSFPTHAEAIADAVRLLQEEQEDFL